MLEIRLIMGVGDIVGAKVSNLPNLCHITWAELLMVASTSILLIFDLTFGYNLVS